MSSLGVCESLESRFLLAAVFAESSVIDTVGAAVGSDREGDYLYIADSDRGLAIYNVAGATPTLVRSVAGITVNDVLVRDNLAYLSLDNGVRILNVANPALPVLVGDFSTTTPVYEVELSGNLAFVAGGPNGLTILDVSQPATPTLVTRISTIGAYEINTFNNWVYVADGSRGLRIVDATNPNTPLVAMTLLAGYNVVDVERVGTNLYVVTQNNGLLTYALTDPGIPLNQPTPVAVHLSTTFAPNNAAMISMDVDGTNGFIGTTTGLFALDLASTTGPALIGGLDLPSTTITDVSVEGGVFVSAGVRGVVTVEVTDAIATIAGGVISITGTSGEDFISAVRTGTNELTLTRNGISQSFALASVTGLRINALGGADYITVSPNLPSATLGGGSGADTIIGTDSPDLIRGAKGADRVWAGAGNDTVYGEDGDDSILGGNGGDYIVGGIGNDALQGGIGRDAIEGSEGNDSILGGNGADTLYGQTGNDTLVGGLGTDLMFAFEAVGRNVIEAADGLSDTISANLANDVLNTDHGLDFLLS